MTNQKGYIALSLVLILLAVISAIAITVSLLSIGEGQSGLASYLGEDTLTFVEGCTEDAILKARASSSYTGGNITRPEGACTVGVSKAGNVWTLTVSTTNTQYVRTIQAVINRVAPAITITSWREI